MRRAGDRVFLGETASPNTREPPPSPGDHGLGVEKAKEKAKEFNP